MVFVFGCPVILYVFCERHFIVASGSDPGGSGDGKNNHNSKDPNWLDAMSLQMEKRKSISSMDGIKQQCLGCLSSCEAAMVDFSFDLANFKDEIDIMQCRRDYLLLFINHVNAELGAARLAFNGAKTRFKDGKGPLNAAEDEAAGDGTSTAQARALARTAPTCQNYNKLNIFHDMKSAGELALDACDARDSLTVATASNADQKKHIQELVSSVKKAVTDLYHARTDHRRAQRD